ncbi:hypothetical protein [Kitasatospora sp. NPDC005751]|uniref:hypothetical protein n=1 Tax=Kitasatospora sp. NPDC005751 TaxID=3157064 RepID=UPI0033D5E0FC
MGDLTSGLVVQGGAAAILSAVVMLILVGRLVPRSVLEDVRADRDAQLAELRAERDSWKAAHATSEEARHLDQDSVRELLEVARTTEHLMRALPSPKAMVEGVSDALDSGLAPQT